MVVYLRSDGSALTFFLIEIQRYISTIRSMIRNGNLLAVLG